jgi:hypothetical protein
VAARDPPPPAADPGAGPTSEDMAPSSAGSLGTTRELVEPRADVVPDDAGRGGTAANASVSGQTHSGGTT